MSALATADLWKKAPLIGYLEADEEVAAAVDAFTGLLAHPLIISAPLVGSKRWRLAVTNRRFIAVEAPLVFRWRRKTLAIPFEEIEQVRVEWPLAASTIVTVKPHETKFKIFGWPVAVHDFLRKFRTAVSAERFQGNP